MRRDPSTLLYCSVGRPGPRGREHDGIPPSVLSRPSSASRTHSGLFRPLHNATAHLLQQCRSIDRMASGLILPLTPRDWTDRSLSGPSPHLSAGVSLEARALFSDLCVSCEWFGRERDRNSEKVVERGSGESSGVCVCATLSRMVLSLNPRSPQCTCRHAGTRCTHSHWLLTLNMDTQGF